MTRLSATATIAALLLLAIAQGFGATSSTKSTKSSPKVATKSTAKAYHVTAQNQFHIKSTKHPSAAMARMLSQRAAKAPTIGPHGRDSALADAGRNAVKHTSIPTRMPSRARAIRPRRNQTNPPTGKIGFVSATEIPSGGYLGDTQNTLLSGSLGTSTALITVIDTGEGCAYSEVQANGDGTFTPLPAAPATWTLVADPYGSPGDECSPNIVFGDVNGDGNSDIVQADSNGAVVTITVLLSNGDGTFTAAAAGLGPASGFTLAGIVGITGGTLVPNATSGFLDLWVVDATEPSNLAQYAGNGDGTFTPILTPGVALSVSALTAPTSPTGLDGIGYNVIIEDLDGDGIPDVAENDFYNSQEAVYLSNQTTPYTGVELTTPDGNFDTCSATAGSLTGSSGLPAIIVTNCDVQTLTVYNNAAGVFSEGVYYPVLVTPNTTAVTDPEGVTIADVNGDGNGDVIVTNDESSDVAVLLGNGDGTLQLTSVAYAVGGYPYAAALVLDLNGDGLPDIIVSDDEFSLTWAAGYGDGTFQAARDYFSPIPGSGYAYGVSIASGDFNGDGFADVVESNCCGDDTEGITVFLSNPDGSLQPGVNYGTGGRLEWVTVGDFNGDGKLDIAATDGNDASVFIFTGTGNGGFIQGPAYSSGGSFPAGIAAATFGSDTATDLVVLNADSSNVDILTNDGTGGFTPGVAIGLNAYGYELVATDLNGDTFPDLAIAEFGSGQVGVLLWDSATSAFDTPEVDYAVGGEAYGIAAADVTGDGNVDLIATVDNGGQDIALLTGNGDGSFNLASSLTDTLLASTLQNTTFDTPWPSEIQVTDVDGDGIPDLVYTNSEYSTVGVLFGTGTGSTTTPAPFFFDPVEFPAGQYVEGVTVANLTGDGSPAVAAAGDDFAGVTTMINANGTAAAPNYTLTTNTPFINVAAGGTATATITLTPVNFYSGTVTFSCGGLPLDVTCAFAPATLTPVGNAPLTTTLTVTTAAAHSALRMPADSNPHQGRTSLLACLTGMGLFGLLLSGDWKNKRNRRVGILLGILVLGMMFSLVGCSSSSTPGTPIGAQTIQVTGTGSDGTTNSVNVTVNVF